MKLDISKNIKRLRRERGMTQERLAELMGVSCTAVSKWESANTYPDITALIPLAELFGVSVDELLGMKKGERAARLEEIKATLKHMQYDDSLSDSAYLEYARQAVAEYPAEEDLQHELAWALSCRVYFSRDLDAEAKTNMIEEAEKILLRLTNAASDEELRCRATYSLTSLYATCVRDTKRALDAADRLPKMEWCRELVKADALSDGKAERDTAVRALQEAIQVLADTLCGKIASLSRYTKNGEHEIAMRETANRIYELIYGDDIKWKELMVNVTANHLAIARARAEKGDLSDALDSLEEMCNCAEAAEKLFKTHGDRGYKSIFLDSLPYDSDDDETCEHLIFLDQLGYRLEGLASGAFDTVRDEERFAAVIARLEELLKNEKESAE